MRLYCPQWCHRRKGWIDLPMLADKKEHVAIKTAEEFANTHQVSTRTIRKPQGWKPEDSKYQLPTPEDK